MSQVDIQIPERLRRARVALVHDWLLTWRGGEKVLEAMASLFPQAPIFTLFHQSALMPESIERHAIHASWLNRIPGAHRRHRQWLPLMPAAVRTLDVGDVDVVISSSHCVAKGVLVPRGARHVSYVHAPLRYMWDRFDDYFGPGKAALPIRWAARALRPALQAWDVRSSRGVHRFVANSRHVASQIAARYQREARVIYPPVELARFQMAGQHIGGGGGYFLCLGALAPYKRIDLAIEAFRGTSHQLWIGGSGQSSQWLRQLPPNVKALGQVSDAELPQLYAQARALIFPGVEDFGITPLEAQACGRPVVAYAAGGALETVTRDTGVFFDEQTPQALRAALNGFDAFEEKFQPEKARAQASGFSVGHFQQALVEELLLALQ